MSFIPQLKRIPLISLEILEFKSALFPYQINPVYSTAFQKLTLPLIAKQRERPYLKETKHQGYMERQFQNWSLNSSHSPER